MLRLRHTPTEANDERTRHDLSRTEKRKLETYNQVQKEDKVIGVNVKKLLIVFIVSVVGFAGVADAASAPQGVKQLQMRQHPFDFVVDVKRTVPEWAKCPDL